VLQKLCETLYAKFSFVFGFIHAVHNLIITINLNLIPIRIGIKSFHSCLLVFAECRKMNLGLPEDNISINISFSVFNFECHAT